MSTTSIRFSAVAIIVAGFFGIIRVKVAIAQAQQVPKIGQCVQEDGRTPILLPLVPFSKCNDLIDCRPDFNCSPTVSPCFNVSDTVATDAPRTKTLRRVEVGTCVGSTIHHNCKDCPAPNAIVCAIEQTYFDVTIADICINPCNRNNVEWKTWYTASGCIP